MSGDDDILYSLRSARLISLTGTQYNETAIPGMPGNRVLSAFDTLVYIFCLQFSERFFQLIDIDGSGRVTFEELMRSLDKLTW